MRGAVHIRFLPFEMTVLYTWMGFEVVPLNELKKHIRTISCKTLSSTLKELEADGLTRREEYPRILPEVKYSLTERGKSLIPILGKCVSEVKGTGCDASMPNSAF